MDQLYPGLPEAISFPLVKLWQSTERTSPVLTVYRPADSRRLQVQACFCFCLLMLERLVNILVPHQLGVLVESLAPGRLPHKELLLYVLFRWLQGGQGLIGSMRSVLWIPISQSTYRRLSTATFEHVLHLSLDFHLSKRIGEVTSALSKGSSLNTFLDGFAFRLFPMVADLFIAAIYFFLRYDAFYAEIVIAMTGIYVFVTIYMAKFRGRMRREMATRSRDMHAARYVNQWTLKTYIVLLT